MNKQNKEFIDDTTTTGQDDEQITFKTENLRGALFVAAELAINDVFQNNAHLDLAALQSLTRSEVISAVSKTFDAYFYEGLGADD